MRRLFQRTKLRLEYSVCMVDAYLADRQGDMDWSAQCLRDARECRCMLEWMR